MQTSDKFFVINIRNLIKNEHPELGEDSLKEILSEFSCPQNLDVESFLKNSAIEFTKKNQSVTYLIFSNKTGMNVGYFTIAVKPITVDGSVISNTTKRKLARISELNEETNKYSMSAYLIAQIGKNYTHNANDEITGEELLELVWEIIEEIQYRCGGVVLFLEAENKEKLLNFYKNNRFSQFDTRMTSSKIGETHNLIQFLRLI